MNFWRSYRAVPWVAIAATWLLCAAQHTIHEAKRALRSSDAAFNDGRLRDSLDAAQRAGSAWLPGSYLAQQAEERLRAIAFGSEATGRRRTALLAWSGVAATQLEVATFTSPPSANTREADQHIERLLPTPKGDSRDNELLVKARAATNPVRATVCAGLAAPLFLVAIVLTILVVFLHVAAEIASKRVVGRFARWLLLAAAAGAWCIGWTLI